MPFFPARVGFQRQKADLTNQNAPIQPGKSYDPSNNAEIPANESQRNCYMNGSWLEVLQLDFPTPKTQRTVQATREFRSDKCRLILDGFKNHPQTTVLIRIKYREVS